MRRAPRRSDSGVAAVEFALVLPLFLLLLMGTIDWGWYFFVDQVVTNAAREGARAASVVGTDGDWKAAGTSSANYYLVSALTTAKGLTVEPGAPINGDATVQVQIIYPVGSLTGLMTGLVPTNAKAISIMRLED